MHAAPDKRAPPGNRLARVCIEVGWSHSLMAARWTVASWRTASLSKRVAPVIVQQTNLASGASVHMAQSSLCR